MSEDSSSDEDWCISTKWQRDVVHLKGAQCWECGEKFSSLPTLMKHYKSHNIKATCHICKVTFCRLTSLSTHLDNVHLPPLCGRCQQTFGNVWELNKHAETCSTFSAPIHQAHTDLSHEITIQKSTVSVLHDSMSQFRPQGRSEMKPERPEVSRICTEYVVDVEDKDVILISDCETTDDSSSSESDQEDITHCEPADDSESDGDSSSTDCSSDSSKSLQPIKILPVPPQINGSVCSTCGRGPFRSMKLHLRHCSGIMIKFQCFRCKGLFVNQATLNEHYMPLYSCEFCDQVFPEKNFHLHHSCPQGSRTPVVIFCSDSRPPVCNICKSFFTSEKTLLNHVTRAHTSVVSTKVRLPAKPSAPTNRNLLPGVRGKLAQSAISSTNAFSQTVNGKLPVSKASPNGKSHPSLLLTNSCQGTTPAPTCVAKASSARSTRDITQGQSTSRSPSHRSLLTHDPPGSPNKTRSTEDTVSTKTPTILAMFENDSKDVALMKRINTSWRSKASYPCRQCGAILRQPSLIISHRYLHRGQRRHQCYCGRAFKHRLHLLRHCVQHAESISYICVSCGETFNGAKLLEDHIRGKSRKKCSPGRTWKLKVKKKCKMPFTCDCGQHFFRPSAYIWHQLKNRTES